MAIKSANVEESVAVRAKSPHLGRVLQRVSSLSRKRQELLASQIEEAICPDSSPDLERFHRLIEKKYTAGLTVEDVAELERLEGVFQRNDEKAYAPVLRALPEKPARKRRS